MSTQQGDESDRLTRLAAGIAYLISALAAVFGLLFLLPGMLTIFSGGEGGLTAVFQLVVAAALFGFAAWLMLAAYIIS